MPNINYLNTELSLRHFEDSEITADTDALAEAVKTTFMLSMDTNLPLSQRSILNALGGRLRDQLRDLLGKVFDAGTPDLLAANADIKTVNARLKAAKNDLDEVADAIEGVGKLIGSIDKLLSIVGILF